MYKIEFEKTEFNNGLNFTVRLGTKWAERLNVGDRVGITKTEHDNYTKWASFKTALIEMIFIMKLSDIKEFTPKVLSLEHDKTCRTFYSLCKTLEKIYPGVNSNSVVTAIGFRLD